ncbi:hypothetical protein WAK64_16055 [Bacillus spongiae]|uniref:Uncharacterized protein n=1 Tax=Bacillus spongiae TaxID=2683610 RepID=A0ABU8HHC6_9BACI
MEVNFDFTFNLIAALGFILSWCVIVFFSYLIYKRQTEKPKVWKIIIVICVGLFSFTINFNLMGNILKLSILPLGVWLMYLVLKRRNGKWQKYRAFAWLGFFANYLFLVTTLIEGPVHQAVYPKSEPTTYIANVGNASIINTHLSANERSLIKESLSNEINSMRQEEIYSDVWYEETFINTEPKERFPYQLVGTKSKWGSGLDSMIYIEKDGKGLLISTSQKQLYFRSENSILEEVE